MEVSLAHELAHHDTRDNLKRMLVACSPDLLGIWPSGRALERRWRAAGRVRRGRPRGGRPGRARLVARVGAAQGGSTAPAAGSAAASGFYDGTLLAARIDRLLSPGLGEEPPHRLAPAWEVFLGSATLFAALLAAEAAWFGVHLATEGLVRFLP